MSYKTLGQIMLDKVISRGSKEMW